MKAIVCLCHGYGDTCTFFLDGSVPLYATNIEFTLMFHFDTLSISSLFLQGLLGRSLQLDMEYLHWTTLVLVSPKDFMDIFQVLILLSTM